MSWILIRIRLWILFWIRQRYKYIQIYKYVYWVYLWETKLILYDTGTPMLWGPLLVFMQSDNFYLLTFSFSVINDILMFLSTILLFVFCLSYITFLSLKFFSFNPIIFMFPSISLTVINAFNISFVVNPRNYSMY